MTETLHRDWHGKTTPGRRCFSADFMYPPALPTDEEVAPPGLVRGTIIQEDAAMNVSWLLLSDIHA